MASGRMSPSKQSANHSPTCHVYPVRVAVVASAGSGDLFAREKKKKKHVGSSCDDKKDLDYCFPGRPDLFWSHLARPAVLTVTSLQESSYPVWYCALFFFNSGHYHEYWLWQNQFPLFLLQGASAAHSFLRIPTLRVPTQNTAGMEKRSRKLKKAGGGGPVVMRRPKRLLPVPLNAPSSDPQTDACAPWGITLTGLRRKIPLRPVMQS